MESVQPAPPPPAASAYSSRFTRWLFRSSNTPSSQTDTTLTSTQQQIPNFGVPSQFEQLQYQKGFKSNSWFHHDADTTPQHKKSVRRIASTPNAKHIVNDKKQPSSPPSAFPPPLPRMETTISSTTTVSSSLTAVDARSQRLNLNRRSYAANSVKIRELQVGPSRQVI